MATTTGATTQQHWRTKYSAILFKSLDHSTDWKLLQLLLSTIASLATITVNSCKIVYLRVCLIDIEYQLPLSSKANSGMNFFHLLDLGMEILLIILLIKIYGMSFHYICCNSFLSKLYNFMNQITNSLFIQHTTKLFK